MTQNTEEQENILNLYREDDGTLMLDDWRREISEKIFSKGGSRPAPYAGISTFLDAPSKDPTPENLAALQVALIGAPMDISVVNRSGARFGPRAVRTMERVGPHNWAHNILPVVDMAVADIGDVPFRGRYDLLNCLEDIGIAVGQIVDAGALPLMVGGEHGISYPALKMVGRDEPVGMIHFDAHCDTAGPFDGVRYHHGAPFRNAVLEGYLDPKRTIQIGIRGGSSYLWEFSHKTGMTVIYADELNNMSLNEVVEKAREVVGTGKTYLSFDVDALDPTFVPGTGTPEVGGLSPREAIGLLRGFKGINFVGGDVVEVNPNYDATTNSAHIGAQILFEVLSLMAFSPSLKTL